MIKRTTCQDVETFSTMNTDFVVFDKGHVEMIPKKGSASALKGCVKWRGKPATLSQMDDAIAIN